MMLKTIAVTAVAALSLALPAAAVEVIPNTTHGVSASDPTQMGRLVRNGEPQTWANTELYPGINNTSTTYNYNVVNVDFAPNSLQDVYYDINVDSHFQDIFVSAYLDSYNPKEIMANWLGDAGGSQDYFDVDELAFDVVVPTGHKLQLVFNSAVPGGGAPKTTVDYAVYAFSDSEYSEDFSAVAAAPEPSSWALMMLGVGALGFVLRRKHRPAQPLCRTGIVSA